MEVDLLSREEEHMAIYVFKTRVAGDFSSLPIVARPIYPMIDLLRVDKARREDKTYKHNLERLRKALGVVNHTLRLKPEDKSEYHGDVTGMKLKTVTSRIRILSELETLEHNPTSERLLSLPFHVYRQYPDPLNVYRTYYMLEGEGYAVYIQTSSEHETGDPRPLVVMRTYADETALSAMKAVMSMA